MASFANDLALKKFILKNKNREWVKDDGVKFLYVLAYKTQKETTKTFYFKYQESDEKRTTKQIKIGKYPSITLAEARLKALELERLRDRGEDLQLATAKQKAITFKNVADEWIDKEQSKGLIAFNKQIGRIEKNLIPYLGNKEITELKRRDYAHAIEQIQAREAKRGITHETSLRTFRLLRKILDLAVNKGYIEHNPTRDIIFNDAFKTSTNNHFKAITEPKKLKELLGAIEEYQGSFCTKQALAFGVHTFLRSANVRELKWQYIDFENDLITFPAEAMKLREIFYMPMSKQVKKLLKTMLEHKRGDFVFPSGISATRPLSDSTLNQAIKRLGFGDEMVFHGLRTTASTLLNENIKNHGFSSDVIELCLDHKERSSVKAIYDRSQRLDERAKLMQWWSDYLDSLVKE